MAPKIVESIAGGVAYKSKKRTTHRPQSVMAKSWGAYEDLQPLILKGVPRCGLQYFLDMKE